MNRLTWFVSAFVSLLILCLISTRAQDVPRVHMSPPPASMDPDKKDVPADNPTLPRHMDLAQLQKEANDLAMTAQTIPADVANVRKGVMPKDVLQKLKQIEKMSKHLRSQLNP